MNKTINIILKPSVFGVIGLLFLQTLVVGQSNPLKENHIDIHQHFLDNTSPRDMLLQNVSQLHYPYNQTDSTFQRALKYHFYDNYNGAYRSSKANVGYSIIELSNKTAENIEMVLHLGNQRIHKLAVFEKEAGNVNLIGITGKHLLDLRNRTFGSNQLAIELILAPNQSRPVHIFHQATLYEGSIDVKLWERGDYFDYIEFEYTVFGIYFGVVITMILFVAFLAFIYKGRQYWLYAIYMFTFLMYVLQFMGYLDYFMAPRLYSYLMDPKIFLSSFAIVCLTYFLNDIIDFKKHTIPYGVQIINSCIILVLLVITITMVYPDKYYWLREFAHHMSNISLVIISFIVIVGILRSAQMHPLESRVLLFSISAILIGYGISIMLEADILPRFDFPISVLQFGVLVELMAITFYLALNIRAISLMEHRALKKTYEAQVHLAQSLYQTRISERNRIHKDLEEDVLSSFNLLKNQNTNGDLIYQELLNDTDHKLSTISSGLSNDYFSIIDLRVKCSELMRAYSTINTVYTIDILLSSTTKSDLLKDLYLITRELYENASKHSQAKFVNIIIEDKKGSIELKYHDNGIGFQKSKTTQGIGMSSIRKRVNELNGQMSIKDQKSGPHITIQVSSDN